MIVSIDMGLALTHFYHNSMVNILQKTFLNTFSMEKIVASFLLNFIYRMDNKSALVQAMTWRQTLPEEILVN